MNHRKSTTYTILPLLVVKALHFRKMSQSYISGDLTMKIEKHQKTFEQFYTTGFVSGPQIKTISKKNSEGGISSVDGMLAYQEGRAPAFNSQYHIKPGMVMHAHNGSTWDAETG